MAFTPEQIAKDLEEIDTFLRKEKVPIPGRPLRATTEFSKKYKIGLPISEPIPGTFHESYVYWPITKFIIKWFDERYGDRLGMDMGPGKCAFVLRGDPWYFHYPKFFAEFKFVLSREHSSDELDYIDGVPPHNAFESIKDFPDGLRKSTTDEELQYLLDTFCLGFAALSTLDTLKENHLVKSSMADFDAAVANIMSSKSDLGLSKWSSLQACEKFLKYVHQYNNKEFAKTHDLAKLVRSLENAGIDIDIDSEISAIQCSPSIRYGEEEIELEEAVVAHHAALSVVYKFRLKDVIPQLPYNA